MAMMMRMMVEMHGVNTDHGDEHKKQARTKKPAANYNPQG